MMPTITERAELPLKGQLIESKSYSPNTDDWYLEVVIAKVDNNDEMPYVTWLYNDSDKGYHEGHYFRTLREAVKDFLKRGL